MSSVERIRGWLTQEALPLWLEQGRCAKSGAFLESLTFGGSPRASDLKRVRVQFRQIYVYSHAFAMGLSPNGLDAARKAFDFVWTNAWGADRRPGWAHVLDQDGAVVDGTRDAYDHAFALYGLSWYQRVSRDPRALLAIRQTLGFMENTLRAENGGWRENDSGAAAPRRQNPHMHCLEAAMSLYQTTGERSYLARASEQFALFSSHFYDPETHFLLEYFDNDWRPLTAEEGQRVEPGHMAEWVWLLREFQLITGKPIDGYANAMFERMLEIGFDETGRFLVDELTVDGAVAQSSRRLWPQTELLKAALAQYRATKSEEALDLAERTIAAIFDEYLSDCAAGGWRDKFGLDGELLADRMPASSFYHLLVAFAMALDVLGDARADAADRALSA